MDLDKFNQKSSDGIPPTKREILAIEKAARNAEAENRGSVERGKLSLRQKTWDTAKFVADLLLQSHVEPEESVLKAEEAKRYLNFRDHLGFPFGTLPLAWMRANIDRYTLGAWDMRQHITPTSRNGWGEITSGSPVDFFLDSEGSIHRLFIESEPEIIHGKQIYISSYVASSGDLPPNLTDEAALEGLAHITTHYGLR